jgi:protein TonB
LAGLLPLRANDLDLTSGSLQFPFLNMQDTSSIPANGPSPGTGPELGVKPVEPLAQARPTGQGWTAAVIVSCLAHAAIATVFLMTPAGTFDLSDSSQIEGADQSGADVAGNVRDSQSPGAMNVTLVPDPQPAKPQAAKPAPPIEKRPSVKGATTQVSQLSSNPVKQPTAAPDILATAASDAQSVTPRSETPASPAVQTETAKDDPAKTVPTAPAQQKTVRKLEQSSPSPRQDATNEPTKATAKPVKPKSRSGSAANSGADAKRGTADGQKRFAATASKGRKQAGVGDAAESNYRSEVIKKLAGVNRGLPRSIQAKARTNAVVAFVVGVKGNINELRILESSGSKDFDQAVLGIVRKASPFSPIPPETGSKSLEFAGSIGPF